MPIKLGLVFTKRQHQQPSINENALKHLSMGHIKDETSQQKKEINLKRIMTAPKTGCKSCGG